MNATVTERRGKGGVEAIVIEFSMPLTWYEADTLRKAIDRLFDAAAGVDNIDQIIEDGIENGGYGE